MGSVSSRRLTVYVTLCFQAGSPDSSFTAGPSSVHLAQFSFLLGTFFGAPVLPTRGRRQLLAFVPAA